jgi:hypothetical protein
LPVISLTMMIAAIGTRTEAARKPAMPTSAKRPD